MRFWYAYLGYQVGLTSTLIRVSKVVADRNSLKISLNNIILEAHFSLLAFFGNFNIWSTLFSKNLPIFCRLRSSFEVVYVKEILALNLFIYKYLHCVQSRLSWSATALDTHAVRRAPDCITAYNMRGPKCRDSVPTTTGAWTCIGSAGWWRTVQDSPGFFRMPTYFLCLSYVVPTLKSVSKN